MQHTYPVHVYSAVKRDELALESATGIELKHTGEWRKKSKSGNNTQRKIKVENQHAKYAVCR